MKTRIGFAAAVAAMLAAAAATASAAQFKYGVSSAEVSQSTVVLWTRAPSSGRVTVEVAPDRRFRRSQIVHDAQLARRSHDDTVRIRIRGLEPSASFYYRFRQGRSRSVTGRFITAPRASNDKSFRFAYSGDADAQRAKGQSKPFYNVFQAYRSMASEHNAFNINLGDTIYSDTEVGATVSNGQFMPAAPTALTLPAKWAKYRQNLGLGNLRRVRGQTSMFNQWDDHEFINDFTVAENGPGIYRRGRSAFLDYMPSGYHAKTGLYRTVRWGKNAELFFLDERSFRSAKASANHVCDNPDTHAPDLAPTAPQSTRDQFAALAPSLARPVSQACLNAIRDPKRTMLGADQLARFTKAIKASTAKWKIVVNEVPLQQFYALPYDRWEGYEAERQKVAKTLASVRNAVVLTTDTHANLMGDIRYQTLEPGGPKDSGVPEMVTGPVATRTADKEIDAATGRPGSGAAVASLFYKPPPPQGIGLKCYATNVFSFTEVQVSDNQLVLRPRDQNGKPLSNPDGTSCGPFTLTAK